MSNPHKEIHVLAAAVHGALVALHSLGVAYNLRKRNHWQTVAHVAGIAFSLDATRHHLQAAVKPEKTEDR